LLKTAGALFLLALGGRALYSAWKPPVAVAEELAKERPGTSFALGAVTNLLNPKVVLFYLSFLPQAAPEWAFFEFSVLYGAAHALMGLLWLGCLVFVAAGARRFLAKPWVKRGVDLVAGLTFVGFGILAWSS
jgi:threonine/homoserine/homoserine lactone efflux protein